MKKITHVSLKLFIYMTSADLKGQLTYAHSTDNKLFIARDIKSFMTVGKEGLVQNNTINSSGENKVNELVMSFFLTGESNSFAFFNSV